MGLRPKSECGRFVEKRWVRAKTTGQSGSKAVDSTGQKKPLYGAEAERAIAAQNRMGAEDESTPDLAGVSGGEEAHAILQSAGVDPSHFDSVMQGIAQKIQGAGIPNDQGAANMGAIKAAIKQTLAEQSPPYNVGAMSDDIARRLYNESGAGAAAGGMAYEEPQPQEAAPPEEGAQQGEQPAEEQAQQPAPPPQEDRPPVKTIAGVETDEGAGIEQPAASPEILAATAGSNEWRGGDGPPGVASSMHEPEANVKQDVDLAGDEPNAMTDQILAADAMAQAEQAGQGDPQAELEMEQAKNESQLSMEAQKHEAEMSRDAEKHQVDMQRRQEEAAMKQQLSQQAAADKLQLQQQQQGAKLQMQDQQNQAKLQQTQATQAAEAAAMGLPAPAQPQAQPQAAPQAQPPVPGMEGIDMVTGQGEQVLPPEQPQPEMAQPPMDPSMQTDAGEQVLPPVPEAAPAPAQPPAPAGAPMAPQPVGRAVPPVARQKRKQSRAVFDPSKQSYAADIQSIMLAGGKPQSNFKNPRRAQQFSAVDPAGAQQIAEANGITIDRKLSSYSHVDFNHGDKYMPVTDANGKLLKKGMPVAKVWKEGMGKWLNVYHEEQQKASSRDTDDFVNSPEFEAKITQMGDQWGQSVAQAMQSGGLNTPDGNLAVALYALYHTPIRVGSDLDPSTNGYGIVNLTQQHIIDPQTGQPFVNENGAMVIRYKPEKTGGEDTGEDLHEVEVTDEVLKGALTQLAMSAQGPDAPIFSAGGSGGGTTRFYADIAATMAGSSTQYQGAARRGVGTSLGMPTYSSKSMHAHLLRHRLGRKRLDVALKQADEMGLQEPERTIHAHTEVSKFLGNTPDTVARYYSRVSGRDVGTLSEVQPPAQPPAQQPAQMPMLRRAYPGEEQQEVEEDEDPEEAFVYADGTLTPVPEWLEDHWAEWFPEAPYPYATPLPEAYLDQMMAGSQPQPEQPLNTGGEEQLQEPTGDAGGFAA